MILNIPTIDSTNYFSIVSSDLQLLDKGVDVPTIDILGESGIGKSEISKATCIQYGLPKENVHLKNLAELGDPSEFLGYPGEYIKIEFTDGTIKSIPTKLIDSIPSDKIKNIDYSSICSYYASPDFVVAMWDAYNQDIPLTPEEIEEGRTISKRRQSVLILDDITRGNQYFLAAVMELINQKKYGSWSLPPCTHIICTSNPDNGVYNVQSTDKAFNSRKSQYLMKFNLKQWLEWADSQSDIDPRIVNWLAVNPEILTDETITKGAASDQVAVINARTIVKGARSILHLDSIKDNNLIELKLGSCIGSDIASMFTMFLKTFGNIPTVQEIYEEGNEESSFKLIENVIHSTIKGGQKIVDLTKRNPMLEHILATRTLNYINNLEKVDIAIITRIKYIMTYENPITKKRGVFSPEHSYHLVKQINKGRSKASQKLAKDPQILRLLSEANKKTN